MINPIVYSAIIRTLVPLLILRRPFYGYAASMLADALGDCILVDLLGGSFQDYHFFDKIFDLYMLTIAVIASLKFEKLEKLTSIVLYSIRALGLILFEITGLRILLVLFPSVFEFYFIFITWAKKFRPSFRLTKKNIAKVIILLAVPKIILEILMHQSGADQVIWNLWVKIRIFLVG